MGGVLVLYCASQDEHCAVQGGNADECGRRQAAHARAAVCAAVRGLRLRTSTQARVVGDPTAAGTPLLLLTPTCWCICCMVSSSMLLHTAIAAASASAREAEARWPSLRTQGDRVEGMKMAKIMNAKRTPLGGFFYPDKQ